MHQSLQQYCVITATYWAFTLTDGALRMLVILYFHQLGYSPLEVASLFLLYEFCGVITNLIGGWLAVYIGLNRAMQLGLILQIIALSMLLVDAEQLSIIYVMVTQAISGIAKDLNKMGAKSSIKLLVPENMPSKLYKWVALLTGSKNALKGIGFFVGALLLNQIGFAGAISSMAICLTIILLLTTLFLTEKLIVKNSKPKFTEIFSKNSNINRLSAARCFLFGSRDIWFVIALPVFLQEQLSWEHTSVGALMALWIIAYGIIQAAAPMITGYKKGDTPDGNTAIFWAICLLISPITIACLMWFQWHIEIVIITGLLAFGALFAINSSVHSYLIIAYAKKESVSLDVGFYYMANALGRLIGTLLSGWIYQTSGLEACLITTAIFILLATIASLGLPKKDISPLYCELS